MNHELPFVYWIPAARPYRPFSFQVSEFQDFYESDSLNDFLCSASGPFSLEFPRLEGFPSLISTGLSSAITTSDAAPRTSLAWTASVGCCVPRTSLAGTASVGCLRMSYRPTDLRIFASSDQPAFASSHLRTFAPSLVIHPIFSLTNSSGPLSALTASDIERSRKISSQALLGAARTVAATAEEPHPDETDDHSLTGYVSIRYGDFFPVHYIYIWLRRHLHGDIANMCFEEYSY